MRYHNSFHFQGLVRIGDRGVALVLKLFLHELFEYVTNAEVEVVLRAPRPFEPVLKTLVRSALRFAEVIVICRIY